MAMGSMNGVDLIEDLLIEILSRLPAKSICRSKCVSKAWYILISDKSNQKRFPHIFHGLFSQSYSMRYDITQSYVPLPQSNVNPDDAPQFNLDFLPFDHNVQIIDSRNGKEERFFQLLIFRLPIQPYLRLIRCVKAHRTTGGNDRHDDRQRISRGTSFYSLDHLRPHVRKAMVAAIAPDDDPFSPTIFASFK
ncbi:F-box only protein 8 [Acorus calamus]|uniref:F-box only protein 8 n=1 Tax=Acorus calamus TaxID=4465 RepID=A0AAV9F3N0_ACOCL|nr:F-box only protein 8 [Acorus calamus]